MALLLNQGDTVTRSYSYTKPSPNHPIYPSETGDLVASGEHAGEYAISITCGSTQNIYLQEPIRKIGDYADIAGMSLGGANRRVEKLVLTGQENWQKHNTIANWFYCDSLIATNAISSDGTNGISSHFIVRDYATAANLSNGRMAYGHPGGSVFSRLIIKYTAYSETDDFKQWLSDQYSAGTPVTVWYVLASPQTEATTMPTITTAKGSNTLTVGTTLPPSSVSVTGHIRPS